MPSATTVYGFIGLGQMGHGMAKNIRQKVPPSCLLLIYDINEQSVESFIQDFGKDSNIVAAASPREIAKRADIILTSVPQAVHVQKVFLDPETGLLTERPDHGRGILFLELSTIDSAVSGDIAHQVTTGGYGTFVDAPCSGGAMGAEAGTLSFMIGCDKSQYPEVQSICSLMGKESSIFYCGKQGSGLKIKLLNNYLSSLTALATAETINIGMRLGLDVHRLNEVLNASSGMNFNSKVNNPVPGLTPGNAASKGYEGGFSLALCLGVLELGYQAAQDVGAKTVLGAPMLEAFRDASRDENYLSKDSKVIYKWLGGKDPKLG